MAQQADSPEVLERFHRGLPMVKMLAQRLRKTLGRSAELEDLMAYGQAGLLEAARRYDASRGVPFKAFATFRIRGAMLDGVRQLSHLPRRVHERLRSIQSAQQFSEGMVEDAFAPAPPGQSPQDIERRLMDHLAAMATAMATGLIAEPAIDEQGTATLVDSQLTPEELSQQRQLLERVEGALRQLPEQEQTLIRRHYFEGERFDALAKELGLSKSWASRLHSRAIGRLTKHLVAES